MVNQMWKGIMGFTNVIMRVPFLFCIDELLMMRLALPELATDLENSKQYKFANETLTTLLSPKNNSELDRVFFILLKSALWTACVLACFGFFMLRIKHLIRVYRFSISVALVFASLWFNNSTVISIMSHLKSKGHEEDLVMDIFNFNLSPELLPTGLALTVARNLVLQTIFATIFRCIHLGPKISVLQTFVTISFLTPSLLGVLLTSRDCLSAMPIIATVVPLIICYSVFWIHGRSAIQALCKEYKFGITFATNYGFFTLLETQWNRLNVPCVLRAFWLLRVIEHFSHMMYSQNGLEDMNYVEVVKDLMVNGCESLTAVLGMTSIISYICHYIGCFFQWILITENDGDRSFGTISATLFYLLAVQNGLTTLDKQSRLLRLCRNLGLLFMAILHFIHNIVNPLLMSLSATMNPALHRHLRALGVCAFLIISSSCLVSFLWSRYAFSSWLLAVSVFGIEVLIKVLITLIIYALYLYDAHHKTLRERLDDYVYMIRSFGSVVDFVFGVILFFNGFWILLFEGGGAIRAFMIGIHAYFNLWCEAKAGWNTSIKRRTAFNKINFLPDASEEQLKELADVCAICYQEMESAKITNCKHYFHSICLRKWLYVQDRCPLCHEILHNLNISKKNNKTTVAVIGDNNENLVDQ